jgi:transketolase
MSLPTYETGTNVAIRHAFGPAFLEIARDNDRLFAVTADLGGSVNLNQFAAEFPDRYVNCGVAEADMIGLCAGLAIRGQIPFAVTFGSFLGRAMDHVRQSIGHNRVNVKVVGSHGGVSNAQDGPSAHALEDIAMFRAIPNMAIVVVSDANQVGKAIMAAVDHPNPVYLRLYREPLPVFNNPESPFRLGQAILRRSGRDVTIVTCGPHVLLALQAADEVSREISAEVIECHTIRPLDDETLLESIGRTRTVITVEDHFIWGGLGSSIAELLGEHLPTPLVRVGLREYATSGKYMDVLDAVGIGQSDIVRGIRTAVEKRGSLVPG